MKNIFTQEKFGQCGYVCLANVFNCGSIIYDNKENWSSGLSSHKMKEIVEERTRGVQSIKTVLSSPKPITNYLPLFELQFEDESKTENHSYYGIFFATINRGNKSNHLVLVIKEMHNKTLTVLDPYLKQGISVNQDKFFSQYPCVELETICLKSDSVIQFFRYNAIKHLFD